MRRTVLPVIATAALALGACNSNGDEPEPTVTQPTGTAPTTTSPQPTDTESDTQDPEPEPTEELDNGPTDETEEPADAEFGTEEQRNPEYPSPDTTVRDLYPTSVRVASHDGYERIVFDFEGTGTPGWAVGYVDETPVHDTGTEADVAGNYTLRVGTTSLTPPADNYDDYLEKYPTGPREIGDTQLIQEVYNTGVWETRASSFIGLNEQAPFRAFTLTDPTRIVVDISTESD